MQPEISYNPYATLSHEKIGNIINFAQFEDGDLLENKHNLVEEKIILSSIYESPEDNNSDDESISMDALKDIQDGNHVHPNINTRYSRLKIPDHIRQAQSECKGLEIPEKSMGKDLHKVFKVILK